MKSEERDDLILDVVTLLRTYIRDGGIAWEDVASGVTVVMTRQIAQRYYDQMPERKINREEFEDAIAIAVRDAMDMPEIKRILRGWMANTMVTAAEDLSC